MLCVDLFCGLGGFSAGFLAEGYSCVGYDIEAHDYDTGGYPGTLVLRDIRSIHGSELKDATVIVASPPCQEPSWRGMPWKASKSLTPMEVGISMPNWWTISEKPSKKKDGTIMRGMTPQELQEWRAWKRKYPRPSPALFIELFDACFRIQREASEAAGRYIPMVVENVRGAQPWVGRAKANFGSFYLWGDVGMVGRRTVAIVDGRLVGPGIAPGGRAQKVPGFRFDGSGGSFQSASVAAIKNEGGSWFAIGGPGQTVTGQNSDGRKTPGRNLSKGSANKFGTHNMGAGALMMEELAVKVPGISLSAGVSVGFNVTAAQRYREDRKSIVMKGTYAERKASGDVSGAMYSSRSNSRKAASAMIAKIPYPLSLYLARAFLPARPK